MTSETLEEIKSNAISVTVSVPPPPAIKVSISPQISSNSLASSLLTKKTRSNSCHELRNNQVRMVPDYTTSLNNYNNSSSQLFRNNNVRLSNRLKQKNVSSILVEVRNCNCLNN